MARAFQKPDQLRSYARQLQIRRGGSVDFSGFVHRLATVATVLKNALVNQPQRASVRFVRSFHKPWASALRLMSRRSFPMRGTRVHNME